MAEMDEQNEAKQREAEEARLEAQQKEALLEEQRSAERELQESQSRPNQIQRALGVPARVAAAMASATHPQEDEMQEWFEDGRLPCSCSLQLLLWEPVVPQLEGFGGILALKESAIAKRQQQRGDAKQQIQELSERLKALVEEEKRCEQEEKALKTDLEVLKQLNVVPLLPFVRSAARVERELASQLETALVTDPESLSALNEAEAGNPKLALLMNRFGANAGTIQRLAEYDGAEFPYLSEDQVKEDVAGLPRDQQVAVLYTHDRLKNGKAPFDEHDCALCDCETPEEMAAFLNENGLEQATADHIRRTGAFGRGALLFLTPQELQLGNDRETRSAWTRCRASHQKADK